MSQILLTVRDAGSSSPVDFALQAPESAQDALNLPAISQGLYLLSGTDGIAFSRHGNSLHIHTDVAAPAAAVITGYYTTPALLAVPHASGTPVAVSTQDILPGAVVPLNLVAGTPDIPWSPGYIVVDGVTDDTGPNTGNVEHNGVTDDLNPTLHGQVDMGAGMSLSIYANTVFLGTVIVQADNSWSFTPEQAFALNATYTFQVFLSDPGSSAIIVALPFTITEAADGTVPGDNLPAPGDTGDITIDGATDDVGLHQGEVGNNGITDDLTPTLHGTVQYGEGLILKIFANSHLLGTVLVGEGGHWSFTPTLEDNAQYTFQVLVQDPASTSIYTAMPFTLTTGFDYATPVITLGYDNVGDQQGALASGQTTDDDTPELRGTADAGATVNIYEGNTLLGSTVTKADGTWSFTPAALKEGVHHFTATATNGSAETLRSNEFVLDIELPVVDLSPVITGVFDDYGDNIGVISNYGTTDDASPMVYGTAVAGATLVLTVRLIGDNGVTTITSVHLTGSANGTWQYQFPDILSAAGDYRFDIVDLSTPDTYASQYYIHYSPDTDTSTPNAATDLKLVDDVAGGIVGELHNNDITNDNIPTLSGKAAAGMTVIISDNGVVIGSASVNAQGNWSFEPGSALKDGTHSYTTVVQNPANGNHSGSTGAINFTVDTTTFVTLDHVTDNVGTKQGDIVNGGTTDDIRPVLSGSAEAGAVVVIHQYDPYTDREYALGSVVADGQGHWTFPFEGAGVLQVGESRLWVVATDAAGNTATSNEFTVTVVGPNEDDTSTPDAATDLKLVDDVAGGIVGELHNNDLTNDNIPTLSGKAAAGTTVIISDNGRVIGSVAVDGNGNWSFEPGTALNDGAHSYTTVVQNPANGNQSGSTGAINFTVDTTTFVTLDHVTDNVGTKQGDIVNGGTTDDIRPVLSGSAEAGAVVVIHQYDPYTDREYALGSVVADGQGHWTFPFEGAGVLQVGESRLWVVATDAAGNTATSNEFTVTVVGPNEDDTSTPDAATDLKLVDDVAGGIVGELHNNDLTNDNIPTLSGKAAAGTTVIISDNGRVIGSVAVDGNGNWSFEPGTALKDGAHSYTTVVQNAAGNQSGTTGAINFTVDTVCAPPVITSVYDDVGVQQGNVANGGLTDDSRPLVSGTAEAGATVTLMVWGPNGVRVTNLTTTVVADASGHWQVEIPGDLTTLGGSGYKFRAMAEDVAGNTSDISNTWVVKYTDSNGDDTSTPDAPLINNFFDDVGSSTGYFNSGSTTDDSTPTLHGTAAAGSVVKIYEGSTVLGSVTADGSGNWEYTTPARADGSHTFTATATSVAGVNSGRSADFVVNVDTDPLPAVPTFSYLEDNYQNQHDLYGSNLTLGSGAGRFAGVDYQEMLKNGQQELFNDLTPTLHGTGAAGTSVQIFCRGHVDANDGYSTALKDLGLPNNMVLRGEATVDSNGNWSFTDDFSSFIPKGLIGTFNWKIVPVDASGNPCLDRAIYTNSFAIKNVAETGSSAVPANLPDIPVFSYLEDNYQNQHHIYGSNLTLGSGAGRFAGVDYQEMLKNGQQELFNDLTPTLHGTGAAGTSVQIFCRGHVDANDGYSTALKDLGLPNNMVLRGEATVDSNGNWSFTDDFSSFIPKGLIGTFNWKIVPVDASGNPCLDRAIYTNSFAIKNVAETINQTHFTSDEHSTLLDGTEHDLTLIQEATIHLQHSVDVAESKQVLTLEDILSHAQQNMFINDGHQQLAVTGDAGDTVELKVSDLSANEWADAGQTTAGGVTYEVYQHAGSDVELLVQQGVELHQVV
jgi:hypothetical protein